MIAMNCSGTIVEDDVENIEDTITDPVTIVVSWGDVEFGHADLFLYEAGGLRMLEQHLAIPKSQTHSLELRTVPGEKQIVLIANSPYAFSDDAAAKLETLERTIFDYGDDDPAKPIMSAWATVSCRGREAEGSGSKKWDADGFGNDGESSRWDADGFGNDSSGRSGLQLTDTVKLELKELMCRIILNDVSNNLRDYVLLEDPKFCITGLNPSAEILRSDGFRPTSVLSDTLRAPLPCDVGFYTQYPGTELAIYPNDSDAWTLGLPKTECWLECSIKGKFHRFPFTLPPLPRASRTYVSVTIDSPTEYTYHCW